MKIRFAEQRESPAALFIIDRWTWRISVSCVCCGMSGCKICAYMRNRLAKIESEWEVWRKNIQEDPSLLPIAADWLDDHDIPEMAVALQNIAMASEE